MNAKKEGLSSESIHEAVVELSMSMSHEDVPEPSHENVSTSPIKSSLRQPKIKGLLTNWLLTGPEEKKEQVRQLSAKAIQVYESMILCDVSSFVLNPIYRP